MEWLVRPLLTIGGAQISLVKLFQFLVAVVVVVVLARMIGKSYRLAFWRVASDKIAEDIP